jgi:hypothetical protein
MNHIEKFIDEDGKIKQLPSKRELRCKVLEYLASKFSSDRDYTEKEINAILDHWHTFNDYFLLRRELIENKFLNRETDCSRYWKEKEVEQELE